MPSLWDLLCVSRQHKYTTHARPKRRPQEAWEDPPYYDPSNAEYYIQPDLPSRRRTDSLPSQASAQLVHVPPPRSPSARRNHKVRESPRSGRRNSPAWYVEVRVPQSPSSVRDDVFYPAEGPPLLNRQESRPVPGYSAGGSYQQAGGSYQQAGGSYQQAGGSYQYSGRHDLLDRDYEGGSSGKRRHVKDIFVDVSNQYQDDRYQPVTSSTMSASSAHSPYNDQVWQPNTEISASKDSLASAAPLEPKQTPRSRQISAHIQNSGYTLPTESRHNAQHSAQPRHNSRYPPSAQPRQASGHPPPVKGSWQSSGLVPPTGPRPGSRSKPPESMHQYSPRTVSDGAISAALLGSRIDDFVHDPGWNRAIDKFAPSPTSMSVSPFEDKSFPRSANRAVSSQKTLSPKDSDGNVTFVMAAQPLSAQSQQSGSDDFHTSDFKTTPQASTTTSPVPGRSPERSPVHSVSPNKEGGEFSQDVAATRLVQRSGNGYLQTSAGSGQEIQMFLGAEGDVLY